MNGFSAQTRQRRKPAETENTNALRRAVRKDNVGIVILAQTEVNLLHELRPEPRGISGADVPFLLRFCFQILIGCPHSSCAKIFPQKEKRSEKLKKLS